MDLTTFYPKYQIVIPKRVCEQFGPGHASGCRCWHGQGALNWYRASHRAALQGLLEGNNTFHASPTVWDPQALAGWLIGSW